MKKECETLSTKRLIDTIIEQILQKKGENITLFHPGKKSTIADWFLICEGTNEIHTRAIGNAILYGLKEKNNPAWHHEGFEQGRWILIDFIDVVVTVILPDLRQYYELDKLWEPCAQTPVSAGYGGKPQKGFVPKRTGPRKKRQAEA